MAVSLTLMWSRGILIFVSLVSVVNCFTVNPIQQDQIRRMGNVVLKCGDIPGMRNPDTMTNVWAVGGVYCLAVVRGKDSWTQSMGVANVATGEAITDNTKFVIGSLTKAFTATLLLTLLQESKERYTVDTPLKDILHQDHIFPDDLRSKEATTKDLLSHRMGLARADLALFAGYPDTFSLADMSRLKQFLPSLGLASNTRDMVKWLKVQLGPYRRSRDEEHNVIADEVIAMTHQPVTAHINNLLRPRFPVPDLTFAYGMGWNQAAYKGFRRIWHSGTLYGFTSVLWLYPDLDIGIFIAVNGPARVPDTRNRINAFLYYVTDLLLGDIPWLSQSTICTYPLPLNSETTKYKQTPDLERDRTLNDVTEYCSQNNVSKATEIFVERYTGTFHNRLFGQVHVYLNETIDHELVEVPASCLIRLGIRFGERFEGILLPTQSRNRFQMKPTGMFEFSAHTIDNELSTMPVLFSNFDSNEMPYSLKALWQRGEMIKFSRDLKGDECFSSPPTSGSTLAKAGAVVPSLILLEFMLNIFALFAHILQFR